jgi:hypothetical protein
MANEIEFTCSSEISCRNHIYCVLNDLVSKVNGTKEWSVAINEKLKVLTQEFYF